MTPKLLKQSLSYGFTPEYEISAQEESFISHAPHFIKWLLLALVVSVVFIGIFEKPAHAYGTIDNKSAIYAIVGEAEDQGYTGMLAVACALRNRGTLKGVYGYKAAQKRWTKVSPKIKQLAELAWVNSDKIDVTHGATGWGNAQDGNEFAKTKWWKNCQILFRHKSHFFYKENV